MDVEIRPEPTAEERAAILAALAEEAEEPESSALIEDPLPVDNP